MSNLKILLNFTRIEDKFYVIIIFMRKNNALETTYSESFEDDPLQTAGVSPTILIVDDDQTNLKFMTAALTDKYRLVIATCGQEALALAATSPQPSLILLDVMMPDMTGFAVIERLKADHQTRDIPVIFVTGLGDMTNETKGLALGAVDYISKPVMLPILRTRVETHLKLKKYQDHLEQIVAERTEALKKTYLELSQAHHQIKSGYIEAIYRLTLASEYKDEETGDHLKRVSHYTKELATALGMDSDFLDAIFHASPMHDLGKVGIPDQILLKSGKLTAEEWEVMKSHTTIGGKILEGSGSPYLQMAQEIATYHHERWCGGGYPEGLTGETIPLTARIMNLCDQYDALRSVRPYKPALSHEAVFDILTKGDGRTMPEHFDPQVLNAFNASAPKFADIFESF